MAILNHLQLNMGKKTKEDERGGGGFQEEQAPTIPVCIGGADVDIVDSYKYLDVDNKGSLPEEPE